MTSHCAVCEVIAIFLDFLLLNNKLHAYNHFEYKETKRYTNHVEIRTF